MKLEKNCFSWHGMRGRCACGVVCLLPILSSFAGRMDGPGGAFAEWSDRTMSVGNAGFTRTYRAVGDRLRTHSVRTAHGVELVKAPVGETNVALAVTCRRGKWSPAGEEGLEAKVTVGGRTTTLWVFPSAPGVLTVWDAARPMPPVEIDRTKDAYRQMSVRAWGILPAAAQVADRIDFAFFDGKAVEYAMYDQTDRFDDLLQTRTRLFRSTQLNQDLRIPSLDVRDTATGAGLVYLRLAPLPQERPTDLPDFVISASEGALVPLANGYPLAELVYEGGEFGRIRALQAFQRALRPYRAGRDGIFLSNTWGDGNGDKRICEEFLLREVDAAAEIGVDVVQLDDGWQRGRTSNSSKRTLPGIPKSWGNYWDTDPKFWTPDVERFPKGFDALVKRAREKGVTLGLWFGPDSSDDLKYWERDADLLLSYHRAFGIRYFKIDSLMITSATGLGRNRAFFDKMLRESDAAMVFDLDCTAGVRPGYFGIADIGPLFLENRYARTQTRRYRPHLTLRNLWNVSHVIDPVRLRIEVLNPTKGRETYRDDPLAPEKWPADALFAIAMTASPLGWMELSDVPAEVKAAWQPLVAAWKRERAALHGGTIVPIGSEPDGYSWTGFASLAPDGASGQAVLFREANARATTTLDLGEVFGGLGATPLVKVLGGRGQAHCAKGVLTATVPAKLDFVWLKLSK